MDWSTFQTVSITTVLGGGYGWLGYSSVPQLSVLHTLSGFLPPKVLIPSSFAFFIPPSGTLAVAFALCVLRVDPFPTFRFPTFHILYPALLLSVLPFLTLPNPSQSFLTLPGLFLPFL